MKLTTTNRKIKPLTNMTKLIYEAPQLQQIIVVQKTCLMGSGTGTGTGENLGDPVVPGGDFGDYFNIL